MSPKQSDSELSQRGKQTNDHRVTGSTSIRDINLTNGENKNENFSSSIRLTDRRNFIEKNVCQLYWTIRIQRVLSTIISNEISSLEKKSKIEMNRKISLRPVFVYNVRKKWCLRRFFDKTFVLIEIIV